MWRRVFIGISAVIAILVVGGLFALQQTRLFPLSAAELTSKHINPPSSWADPDCARLRHAVRTAVSESRQKTGLSVASLNADEVAVYKAVFYKWNSDGRTLNVSNRTFPLDVTSPTPLISSCECLRNLEVQSLASASHSFHYLTRTVFPERNIRLVDADEQLTIVRGNDPHRGIAAGKSVEKAVKDAFASGLFSLSEIAFDRDHHLALVSYGFVCGSLCGNGGTWLLENVDGVWEIKGRDCGGWVS